MSPPTSPNLMTLPTDLHLQILEYILPLPPSGTKSITFYYHLTNLIQLPSVSEYACHSEPSLLALNSYLKGIALVNRQFHQESLRIFYARVFILEFKEASFWEYEDRSLPLIDRHHESLDKRSSGGLPRWCKAHPGDNGDLFPGLYFGAIQELRVAVRPSDWKYYWTTLTDSMESLCRALRPKIMGQGLKNLTLDVGEVEVDMEIENLSVQLRRHGRRRKSNKGVHARPADVIALLEVMWLYLRGVEKCEVLVPARLLQDKALVEAVTEVKSAVCGPWTEGDLVAAAADEELALAEKPFYYARRSGKPVSWSELTEEDIRNKNYIRIWDDIEGFCYIQLLGEQILLTEMTAQDREDSTFASHWHFTVCLQFQPGLLVQGTYLGRLCYYWKNDEKDKWLWHKLPWEVEDDFYRG